MGKGMGSLIDKKPNRSVPFEKPLVDKTRFVTRSVTPLLSLV